MSDEGRKLCEECWVCQTKQGVLWSGKWVAWFLDDLSTRMFLPLDSSFPIGAESKNQKQEFSGFDAKPVTIFF